MSRCFWFLLRLVLAASFTGFYPPLLLASSTGEAERDRVKIDNDQVCDPVADYYLGMEDYPKSVALHRIVLQKHPDRALAYYHLGFAYGVMGDRERELAGYQKAIELGLNDWALFLNLGRLYLETDRLDQASSAFQLATLLAPYRSEGHYNLGLTYERLGMLRKAEQETLLSLRLRPNQNDARNTLGIIYAEEGNYVRAYQEWDELARANPDYTPARANLAILKQVERRAETRTGQSGGFAQAP